MSILSRVSAVVKAKMNRILDDAEDPQETLDYAYALLMQTIGDSERLKEEIRDAKNRLRVRASRINVSVAGFHGEALRAIASEDEETARGALQHRQASTFMVDVLHGKIVDLNDQEHNLTFAGVQVMQKRFHAERAASPEEIIVHRTVMGKIQEEGNALSLAISQAKHVLDNIDNPRIPEDFLEEDAVCIIKELAPLLVAQRIEDELAYWKMQSPGIMTGEDESAYATCE